MQATQNTSAVGNKAMVHCYHNAVLPVAESVVVSSVVEPIVVGIVDEVVPND